MRNCYRYFDKILIKIETFSKWTTRTFYQYVGKHTYIRTEMFVIKSNEAIDNLRNKYTCEVSAILDFNLKVYANL